MSSAENTSPFIRSLHVGVGNRGTWPLEEAERCGYLPSALCDINPEMLTKAREMCGLPEKRCFSDLGEAIKGGGYDCAIICTPTQFHVPMSLQAMEAGLPVLVEKGMAPDWKSAQYLVSESQRLGVRLAVAQNYRFGQTPKLIKRALTDESFEAYLGHVHQVLYVSNRVRPNPRTLTYPFAAIWDMSCHHLDNLLYWFGPVERLQCFEWKAPWSAYEFPNNNSAQIYMANGTAVTYAHTHDAARISEEIQLHGERGALFIRENKFEFSERPLKNFGTSAIIQLDVPPENDVAEVLKVFSGWIHEDIEPGISARHNLETMAFCEMMVRSLQGGCMIDRKSLNK